MSLNKTLEEQARERIENMDTALEGINSGLEGITNSVEKIRKRFSFVTLVPTLVVPLLIGYSLFHKAKQQPTSELSKLPTPQNISSSAKPIPKSNLVSSLISHLGFETSTAIAGSLLTYLLKKK